MPDKIFIATTGKGLARAEAADGQWTVTHLLLDEGVLCLALDPTNLAVAYVATRGNGVLRPSDLATRSGALRGTSTPRG